MATRVQTQIRDSIARLRKEANLSAAELAERAELSRAFISRLENGKFQDLTLITARKLAKGLNMPLQAFMQKIGYLSDINISEGYELVSNALRTAGLTQQQTEEVVHYAKFVESKCGK